MYQPAGSDSGCFRRPTPEEPSQAVPRRGRIMLIAMTAVANILCAVDLSDISRRALDYAVALSAAHDAPLRVVHVVDAWRPAVPFGAGTALPPEARASLEEELNWFVAPAAREGVEMTVTLVEGTVVDEILDAVVPLSSPLVVIGTHGRGGFERFAIGSVAEKVLRRASVPVLAVPPGAGSVPTAWRRIVCAVDFSAASRDALAFGAALGEPASANTLLLNVLEWPFGDTSGPDPVTALRESLEAEARDNLDELSTAVGARVAERAVRRGKPSREIVQFARERDADLIVMGVTGRGALDMAILGSTAQQVLRDAPCPVVTVPASTGTS